MGKEDIWLLLAGLVAGSVNAAAGGGTLLSFPALLAIGLSPLAANATSTFGLLPGSMASIWAYRGELWVMQADARRILWPCLAGGVIGAWLLVALGDAVFSAVVPALLLSASGLLLVQPLIARWIARRSPARNATAAPFGMGVVLAVSLVVAIYVGYFGAGGGILFLGAMGLLLARPLGEINALKVTMAALSNGVAAVTFTVLELGHPTGALQFRRALPIALGALFGGYGGVRVVRRLPSRYLGGFAAFVGVAIAFYLVLRK